MSTPQDILSFWFGDDPADLFAKAENWWKKDEEFDRLIKDTFESTLIQATQGKIETWRKTPHSCLAYIILLDQFSRNIYRQTPKMFAQDPLALSASLSGQEQGLDRQLNEVEQWFFYMPMQHSEQLEMQRRSVAAFRALADNATDDFKPSFENAYDYAVRHCEIIERFGRFPHRNVILGRHSTGEEIAFLKEPGSSF